MKKAEKYGHWAGRNCWARERNYNTSQSLQYFIAFRKIDANMLKSLTNVSE